MNLNENLIEEEGFAIAKDDLTFETGKCMWRKGVKYKYAIDDCNLAIETEQRDYCYWLKISKETLVESFEFENKEYAE